jgi:hypothetical protein
VKTYDELTSEQQESARLYALHELLMDICEHGLRFDDSMNEDDLQARIDAAGKRAERMRTSWFWCEYILDTCREELECLAAGTAEDAVYTRRIPIRR